MLRDYQSNKKSNVVLDKRFGESDPTMSLEEKMFMRFQKERVKNVRNSSAFNLESGGGDTEVLTHRGQVLGNSNLEDNDWVSSDDDEAGGKLNKEVVNSLHFGGGLQQKQRSNPHEDMEQLPGKERLDALQEIVMKSKLHKMQKKEAKEEQEDEREKLDKAYKELFSSSLLDFKPSEKYSRSDRSNNTNVTASAESMDDYDMALKEMSYEAKLPASERTKTIEEIALEEQKRIEELEEARIKRMKAPLKSTKQHEDEDEILEGKSQKRKHRTDDEIVDDSFPVYENKTKKLNAKEERKAAANEVNDEAYKEYIMQDEEYSESEEEVEDDEEEDSGDEGSDQEEEDEDSDKEESDQEEGSGDEGSDQDEEEVPSGDEGDEWEEAVMSDNSDEEQEEEEEVKVKASSSKVVSTTSTKKTTTTTTKKTTGSSKSGDSNDEVNLEMPHKIDCPPDLESFDELIEQYVRYDTTANTNIDMVALIDRILAWNNVNLPGAEGKENRNLMHNFLDVLLKHFMRVGDGLSSGISEEVQKMSMEMVSVAVVIVVAYGVYG